MRKLLTCVLQLSTRARNFHSRGCLVKIFNSKSRTSELLLLNNRICTQVCASDQTLVHKMATSDTTATDSTSVQMNDTAAETVVKINENVTAENDNLQDGVKDEIKNTEEITSQTDVAHTAGSSSDGADCSQAEKRPHDDDAEKNIKRQKQEEIAGDEEKKGQNFRKKKVAMLLVYSGQNYNGMQKNPGFVTIESDLNDAMVKAGVINQEHADAPNKMQFQRASRTDKGVSAAGQLCSMKMFIDVESPVEKINSHLPSQIKVIGIKRVTKGFCSKNNATARTYLYLCPTFAFTPIEQPVKEDFRISDDILTKIRETLAMYKGTHNFFNFTSGKKPDEMSANRYIMDFQCNDPFIQDGIELVALQVKGQSFMLHQIRKMIGLAIAIVRGIIGPEVIEKSWQPIRRDIPKAPGLGLMLDKVHFDHYNKRYGSDGMHEPIKWEQYEEVIENFKQEFIFSKMTGTEKKEKSMLNWLSDLHLHHFGATTFDGKERLDDDGKPHDKMRSAFQNLYDHRKAEQGQQTATDEATTKVEKDETDTVVKETIVNETDMTEVSKDCDKIVTKDANIVASLPGS